MSIKIKAYREATAFAQSSSYEPPNGTLAIWADSSIGSSLHNKPCATVVGYNLPTPIAWTAQVTIAHYATAREAGLLAIGEALRVAVARTKAEHFDRVLVFSCAYQILKSMDKGSPFGHVKNRWLLDDICRLAKELNEKEISLEAHWVPNQAKVEEHQPVRCYSQRYRDLALAACPLDSTNHAIGFPLLRLDGMLTMEDARTELHQLFRAWLWHAIAQEEDKPLMSLYQEKRLEARRASEPVKRERE